MLTCEEKLDVYERRKNGETINSLASRFQTHQSDIKYLIRLIDYHGLEIVKSIKQKRYSYEFKEQAIDRVLIDNNSITSVAVELGLSSTSILRNWLKKRQENGYTLKKDNQRSLPMKKPQSLVNNNISSITDNKTIEEKIKQLEEENLYLKAENEYLKKLKALAPSSKK